MTVLTLVLVTAKVPVGLDWRVEVLMKEVVVRLV